MPERVETWLWLIRDAETGRLRITRHRLTVEDAQSLHPGAKQVPGSMEVAEGPAAKDAELGAALAAWIRGARKSLP